MVHTDMVSQSKNALNIRIVSETIGAVDTRYQW